MRALIAGTLVLAATASAGDFTVGSPLTDERKVIAGRLGESPGDVSARALFVSGKRNDDTFTQAGGEVVVQGALHFFQTSFGGILGAEADFSLGGASNEKYADGTVRDQRRNPKNEEERTKDLVWVTSRLGIRFSLSLPILQLGQHLAFRLGAVGGAFIEANGSRSFEFSPGFTAGAQLSMVLGPVSALASYLSIPTQDLEAPFTAHKLTLDLGIGPVMLGATLHLASATIVPKSGMPGAAVTSQTLDFHLGYRFSALDLK